MVRRIQFRPVESSFQYQLMADVKTIRKSRSVIVQADKTTNLHRISVADCSRKIRRKQVCRRKTRLRNFRLRKFRLIGEIAVRQFCLDKVSDKPSPNPNPNPFFLLGEISWGEFSYGKHVYSKFSGLGCRLQQTNE